jgi:hypothetical protein
MDRDMQMMRAKQQPESPVYYKDPFGYVGP